jgi:hypothetical protein
MWKEYTADDLEALSLAHPNSGVRANFLQQMRRHEAQGARRFLRDTADDGEDDPDAWLSITVVPYERFASCPVRPLLWEHSIERAGHGVTATLLLALVCRVGDVTHFPVDYDGRLIYFHLLWDAAAGSCEVLEDGRLTTYWCTDLADFLSQYLDYGPDAVEDEETH